MIICALNERDSLPRVLARLPQWVSEVLLVDGRSTDGTVETARRIYPGIKIVTQTGRGKGDALRCGISAAGGRIIVTLDADGATDPAEMGRFIAPLQSGYDFAKGSRFKEKTPSPRPLHRVFGNFVITSAFNILFGARYTDVCSGYNAFWKEKILGVDLQSADGFENEPLFNARVRKAGLKVVEVSHTDGGRFAGEVKEKSWRQGPKALKSLFRERFFG